MPKPMTPQAAIAEKAMSVQVAVEELWDACRRTNDFVVLAEAAALRRQVRPMRLAAMRIAGRVERIDCEDGLWGPAHGAAA